MEFRNEDRDLHHYIPPLEQPVLGLTFNREESVYPAIVKLLFDSDGTPSRGNAFFVNIPWVNGKVILTAAHNLISKTKNPSKNMRAKFFGSEDLVPIPDACIHINPVFAAEPSELSAEDDYGAIVLPPDLFPLPDVKDSHDFGFSMALGFETRLDCDFCVTGYRGDAKPGAMPVTSTGHCINPIIRPNQLEYMVATEPGISGSPVWTGYKRYPTVVGIHNYGPKYDFNPSYGSRATRINEKVLNDIFAWANVGVAGKSLTIDPANAAPRAGPIPLPLQMSYSADDKMFTVAVDDAGADTALDMVPVYAPPLQFDDDYKPETESVFSLFAFRQTRDGENRWVSWNREPSLKVESVSLVDDLRRARSAYLRRSADLAKFRILLSTDTALLAVAVLTGSVKKWMLEESGEVFNGLGFVSNSTAAYKKDTYADFVLK